ncbi:MAG: hypothetical protein Q9160_005758 [Pyrenula sp. 1 TL-2023]
MAYNQDDEYRDHEYAHQVKEIAVLGIPVTADSPPSETAAPTPFLRAISSQFYLLASAFLGFYAWFYLLASAFLGFCAWTVLQRRLNAPKQAPEEQSREPAVDPSFVNTYVWGPSVDTVKEVVANVMRGEFASTSTQTDEVFATKDDLWALQTTAGSRMDSIDTFAKDNGSDICRLTASVEGLKGRVDTVSEQSKTEAGVLNTSIDALQEDVDKQRKWANDLERRVKDVEGPDIRTDQALEAERARIDTVERKFEGLSDIKAFDKRIKAFEKRVNTLEQRDADRAAPEYVQVMEKRVLNLESALVQMTERATRSEAAIANNAGKANEKANKQMQALVNHQGAVGDLQRSLLVLGSAAAAEVLVMPREKKPEGQALVPRLSREKIAESFPQTYAIRDGRLVTCEGAQGDSHDKVINMTKTALDAYWRVAKIDQDTFEVLCNEVSASVYHRIASDSELYDPEGLEKWAKVVDDEVTKAVQQLEKSRAATPPVVSTTASSSVAGPVAGPPAPSPPTPGPHVAGPHVAGPRVAGPPVGGLPVGGAPSVGAPVAGPAPASGSAPPYKPTSALPSTLAPTLTSTPASPLAPASALTAEPAPAPTPALTSEPTPAATPALAPRSRLPAGRHPAAMSVASAPSLPQSSGGLVDKVASTSTPPPMVAPSSPPAALSPITTSSPSSSGAASPTTAPVPTPTRSSPPAKAQTLTLADSRWAKDTTEEAKPSSKSPAPLSTTSPPAAMSGAAPAPSATRGLSSSRWAKDDTQEAKTSSKSAPSVSTASPPSPPAAMSVAAPAPSTTRGLSSSKWAKDDTKEAKSSSKSSPSASTAPSPPPATISGAAPTALTTKGSSLSSSRWAKDNTQEAKTSSKPSPPVSTASSPPPAATAPAPSNTKSSGLSSSRWASDKTQKPKSPSSSPVAATTSASAPTSAPTTTYAPPLASSRWATGAPAAHVPTPASAPTTARPSTLASSMWAPDAPAATPGTPTPAPTTTRASTLSASRWATDDPQTSNVSSSPPAPTAAPEPTPTPAPFPVSAPPSPPSSGATGVPALREGPSQFLLPETAPKMAAKHPEFWKNIPSLEKLTNMNNDHKARWIVAKSEAERTESLEAFRGVLEPRLHHLLPPKASAPLREERGGYVGARGRGNRPGGRDRR